MYLTLGMKMFTTFLTSLNHLAILELEGDKPSQLLQGQLSADIALVNTEQALPALLCSLKGRVLSSLDIISLGLEKYGLIIPTNNQELITTSLSKFLPFFKTTLTPVTDSYHVIGLSGKDVPALTSSLLGAWPKEEYGQAITDTGLVLNLPGPQARALIMLPRTATTTEAILTKLSNLTNPADEDCWNLLDIKTGRAQVDTSLSDIYLPQMLNYQAIGAISFNKGCYLGQEIIARTQFRGQVKRRLFRAHLATNELSLPAQVYDAQGKAQGEIIQLAADRRGEYEALAVIRIDAATPEANLYADAELTKKIILLKLPYDPETRQQFHSPEN